MNPADLEAIDPTQPFALRDTWRLDTRHLGRRVLVYRRLDSTNSRAAELARAADSDGLAVLADEQTAGRGQHGRSWQAAPRSSVLLSLLLHPPGALARPAVLTAWAAVSVCATVRRLTGWAPRIKWPNDVLLREQKVCGILIEQAQAADRLATVVGIGLNVQQTAEDFARAGLPLATSLRLHREGPLDTDDVARLLLGHLDAEYDRLLNGDSAALQACWLSHLGLLGKNVIAECTGGRYEGRLAEATFERVLLDRPGRGPLVLAPEVILHLDQP
jgi:BirA family biotin operon repressor/biotin-[acetyl-CoA-carboxylase] ligase